MKIKYLLLVYCATLLPTALPAAPTKESKQVREIIARVNDRRQTDHPAEHGLSGTTPPIIPATWRPISLLETRPGAITRNAGPSITSGKEPKAMTKSKWQFATYGEDDEHVMFGDWQICFQTYADLYRLLPDDRKISRAREVMEYQMSTPENGYWWWADGLYMVMPVMTKTLQYNRQRQISRQTVRIHTI